MTTYNKKYLNTYLAYQRKLRESGLYCESRATQEAIKRMKDKQYINNALLCVKYLFKNN